MKMMIAFSLVFLHVTASEKPDLSATSPNPSQKSFRGLGAGTHQLETIGGSMRNLAKATKARRSLKGRRRTSTPRRTRQRTPSTPPRKRTPRTQTRKPTPRTPTRKQTPSKTGVEGIEELGVEGIEELAEVLGVEGIEELAEVLASTIQAGEEIEEEDYENYGPDYENYGPENNTCFENHVKYVPDIGKTTLETFSNDKVWCDSYPSLCTGDISLVSPKHCQNLCQRNKFCAFWTYATYKGGEAHECYLQDQTATHQTVTDGSISGPRLCPNWEY